MTVVPILLYHSVSSDPEPWIAPYSVTPTAFAGQVEAMAASGRTPMTVSEFVAASSGYGTLPDRPLVVTFDDGFADFPWAAEILAAESISSTLYVTTGALRGRPPTPLHIPPAPMLAWSQLRELDGLGVEIGAHTHTHPQLDILPTSAVTDEVQRSKGLLEEFLGRPVPSFAYPHGFHSARVHAAVARAGCTSACAVMNALSSSSDRPLILARLTVRADTPSAEIALWLAGCGAPIAPYPERWRTGAWRTYRRLRGTRSSRGVFVRPPGKPSRQAPTSNRSQ
ncbi:polysaccharide deacetylase family protein [Rhodococcus chondri]|uniref:Polysaccharide deacetylase family protein n=1 Tax=Rhodococcus chondri TaxID=3065941 RepID=A0ABU7JNL9_9NOCA|nr:polysaccharide deacetylase family protein [Rhodococcus sp. CC-R104]MEE2031641.1 polysaccharide deacetylase family protein [Rhodococcus sp. CC-R104]